MVERRCATSRMVISPRSRSSEFSILASFSQSRLTLALRKHQATITDDGVEAIRKRPDEVCTGKPQCCQHFFLAGIRPGPQQVPTCSFVEQKAVRTDIADSIPPAT